MFSWHIENLDLRQQDTLLLVISLGPTNSKRGQFNSGLGKGLDPRGQRLREALEVNPLNLLIEGVGNEILFEPLWRKKGTGDSSKNALGNPAITQRSKI